MASMFVRHHVRDFATWKPIFDEHEPKRREHGLTGHSLHRGKDDPNDIIIAFRAADLKRATDFASSEDLRATMERAGVEGQPEIWFAEDFEEKRYS
jgi:hypothetical protein